MGGDYYWIKSKVEPNIDEKLSYTYRTFMTGGEDLIREYFAVIKSLLYDR